MPNKFQCYRCQATLEVPDGLEGKTCECPSCGTRMTVPAPPSDPPFDQTPGHSHPGPPQPPPAQQAGVFDHNPYVVPSDEQPANNPFSQPLQSSLPSSGTHYGNGPGGIKPHRGDLLIALGVVSLVTGVGQWLCCLLFFVPTPLAIVTIVLACTDLREMQEGRMDPAGASNTRTGRLLAIIALVMVGVGSVLGFALNFLGAML